MEQNFFKEIIKEQRVRRSRYWIHFVGITGICMSVTIQYLFPYWSLLFLQKQIGINTNAIAHSKVTTQHYNQSLIKNQQLKKQLVTLNEINQTQQNLSKQFWNHFKDLPIEIKVNGIQYKNDGTLNYYIETSDLKDVVMWTETLHKSHELKILRCNELKYMNNQYQLHLQCQIEKRGERNNENKADNLPSKH